MTDINRRSFTAAGLAGTLLAVAGSPAKAENRYKWRMATSWPKNLPLLHDAAVDFARSVSSASGGRLEITVVDPSDHKMPVGILDLVTSGAFELGHTTAQYYVKDIPAIDYFTAVPFGLTAVENHIWMEEAGGKPLFERIMAQHGVVPFIAGNTNVQMGGWYNREINDADDLQGLRIRISGITGTVFERLGAKAVSLPFGQIIEAFETNKLDASDIVGPAIDASLPIAKYAPYYYGPWHEPDVAMHLFVSKARYEALPEDLKEILATCARSAALRSIGRSQYQNAIAMAKLAGAGAKFTKFPPALMTTLRSTTMEVLNEAAGRDADSKAVIESFLRVREKMVAYAPLADGEIIDNRVDTLHQ